MFGSFVVGKKQLVLNHYLYDLFYKVGIIVTISWVCYEGQKRCVH